MLCKYIYQDSLNIKILSTKTSELASCTGIMIGDKLTIITAEMKASLISL